MTALFILSTISLGDFIAKYAGTPYLYGGEGYRGIDCSALVQRYFQEVHGMYVPRTAHGQYMYLRGLGWHDTLPLPQAIAFWVTTNPHKPRGFKTHVAIVLRPITDSLFVTFEATRPYVCIKRRRLTHKVEVLYGWPL